MRTVDIPQSLSNAKDKLEHEFFRGPITHQTSFPSISQRCFRKAEKH